MSGTLDSTVSSPQLERTRDHGSAPSAQEESSLTKTSSRFQGLLAKVFLSPRQLECLHRRFNTPDAENAFRQGLLAAAALKVSAV